MLIIMTTLLYGYKAITLSMRPHDGHLLLSRLARGANHLDKWHQQDAMSNVCDWQTTLYYCRFSHCIQCDNNEKKKIQFYAFFS